MANEVEGRPRRIEVDPGAVAELLATTALFAGCDRGTLDKIAPHVYAVQVPAGMAIVRAGTPDPGIGFVVSGRASVRPVDPASGAVTNAELVRVGEAFGETGAFLGTAQPHDVVADEDSVVFLLEHDVVVQLASKVAAFSFAAARRLARRVTTSPPPLRAHPRSTSEVAAEVIRFVRVSAYDPTPQLVATVPAKLIRQYRLLPLELRDRTLTVGMVDPTNAASRAELQRVLSTTSVVVVAISQDDFHEAYVRLRIDSSRAGRGTRSPDAVPAEQLVFDHADQEREAKQTGPIGDEIVTLASRLIAHAIERGASDVHLDHGAHGPRVRFRVQGQLYDWDHSIPANHGRGLVARLKVLAAST
jgi:CRP-like cAMP-binding protein